MAYRIEKINEENVSDALLICESNPFYYESTGIEWPTLESCRSDITALPEQKEMKDKTFVLVYEDKIPIALIDFIARYPNDSCGFIGLFMVNGNYHHQGVGSFLYQKLEHRIAEHFTSIRLACYRSNSVGLSFWQKNGYVQVKDVNPNDGDLLVFEKSLIA